jgi:protein SCO1/2
MAANRSEHGPARAQRGPPTRFAGAPLPAGVRMPAFALRDQDGRLVTPARLRGRPLVVTFVYARCGALCATAVQQVKGALDDLATPASAIGVSVDPRGDTPSAARRFLDTVGMAGRMRFLLGSRAQLAPVWRGFAISPASQRDERGARLVVVDAHGRQRVAFPIAQVTPERLAHDLRALGAD